MFGAAINSVPGVTSRASVNRLAFTNALAFLAGRPDSEKKLIVLPGDYDIGHRTPTRDLDFANKAALPSPFSFTRASTATRIKQDGLVEKNVAADVLRYDHRLNSGLFLGALLEGAATNVVAQSENLAVDPPWVALAGMEVTNPNEPAPDGTASGTRLAARAGGLRVIRQEVNRNPTSEVNVCFSVYLRRLSGEGSISLSADNGTTWKILTAVTGTEWARYDVTANIGTATNYGVRIRIDVQDDEIAAWGAQSENGTFPTSYIPTTTGIASRAADNLTASIPGGFFNTSVGSWIVEWLRPANFNSGARIADANATTDETKRLSIELRQPTAAKTVAVIDPDSGLPIEISRDSQAVDVIERAGFSYKFSAPVHMRFATNGVASTEQLTVTSLTGLNKLQIGDWNPFSATP